MSNQKIFTMNFFLIWITIFLIFTVFYSLITTLPIYLATNLNMQSKKSGLIIGMFLFVSVLFRPLAGNWLDQYGKKQILLTSVTIFLISTFLYFILQDFLTLMILRFVHGASFGIATTATGSIVTDVLSEKVKGKASVIMHYLIIRDVCWSSLGFISFEYIQLKCFI